ncbi:MAG: hypothetical protein GXC73_12550 [Chitinophagaceae bacterium]|jgi:hypothetical protein|nr:hypothetical protein [Chitinophagaceae bacterium]
MSEEKKFNVDLLRIENILIKSAGIENPDNILAFDSQTIFDINITLSPGINVEHKKLMLIFNCVVTAETAGTKTKASCKFEIAYFFQVENLNNLIQAGKTIEVDDDLAISVANIAYSTSRGIIFTRCQGTIFSKLIIPVASNDELLTLIR